LPGEVYRRKLYIPAALHQGYTTEDEQHWVSEECFQDFKETFSWKVIDKTS